MDPYTKLVASVMTAAGISGAYVENTEDLVAARDEINIMVEQQVLEPRQEMENLLADIRADMGL